MSEIMQQEPKPNEKEEAKKAMEGLIDIKEFSTVQLRIAKVLDVQDVEGKDRLLEFKMDVGPMGERTILSGIKQFVTKEEMMGKKVAIVANLKPRNIAGKQSQGMLLTVVTADDKVLPLILADHLPEGSQLV